MTFPVFRVVRTFVHALSVLQLEAMALQQNFSKVSAIV